MLRAQPGRWEEGECRAGRDEDTMGTATGLHAAAGRGGAQPCRRAPGQQPPAAGVGWGEAAVDGLGPTCRQVGSSWGRRGGFLASNRADGLGPAVISTWHSTETQTSSCAPSAHLLLALLGSHQRQEEGRADTACPGMTGPALNSGRQQHLPSKSLLQGAVTPRIQLSPHNLPRAALARGFASLTPGDK